MAKKETQKKYYEKNKKTIIGKTVIYRRSKADYFKEYKRKWRLIPKNKQREHERLLEWKKKNPTWYKDWYFSRKKICIAHYSNDRNCCQCCGESSQEFLSIDHINGGGSKHRKEIGANNLYSWMIKNNFPDGFRILCFNCNQALGIYGYCPHKRIADLINIKHD